MAPPRRLATFDQDGTLWVEHPIYTQVVFAFDRLARLAPQHPQWKKEMPYRAVLTRDRSAIAKFTTRDFEAIVLATHSGISVDAFRAAVSQWIAGARDPRWHQRYTALVYEPMLEVMRYLRKSGYATYIVTGGGQEFVRAYAQSVYGVPPERVIGSALATQFSSTPGRGPVLIKSARLLLDDNMSGKPEDIYLFTGRQPQAAFGNSDGDRQMLEYAQTGGGTRLLMMVLHDDATREYAYGPATKLPDTKFGTFSQSLYAEARKSGWIVPSMRRDWKRVFAFER